MNKPLLIVSSITYAMKGQEILKRQGIKATVRRVPKSQVLSGCGYGLLVTCNPDKAEDILSKFQIKVLGRMDSEDAQ